LRTDSPYSCSTTRKASRPLGGQDEGYPHTRWGHFGADDAFFSEPVVGRLTRSVPAGNTPGRYLVESVGWDGVIITMR